MILHFKTEEHQWLSNMYYCTVQVGDDIFPSAEHAYMSFKSEDPEWKDICKDANNNPKLIKKFSQTIKLVENWKDIRLQVMEQVIEAKFKIEPLRSMLLLTGDENIQEGNWWKDKFWGVDLNQTPNIGENHLGRIIMKTRDKLKNNQL